MLDELTLRVDMKQPWASWPTNLTGQAGVVTAPEQLDSGKEQSSRVPIGTGPFKYQSWTPDKTVEAVRNPSYWHPGLPYLEAVSFRPITDSGSRVTALQAGDINVTITSRNEDIAKLDGLAASGTIRVVRSQGESNENLVLLNTAKAPTNDLRVRQAMAYAIDRVTFRAVTGSPEELSANGMFASDSKWYSAASQDQYPTFDLEKAKQLVQDYESEIGPIQFELGATSDPVVIRSAQLLQAQFQDAGMDVSVKTLEQSAYITNAVTGDYTAQMWRQFGAPDPDGDYTWFLGANDTRGLSLNMARKQDPQVDAALNDQRATNDLARRQADWATIQARHNADLPYLWLAHQPYAMATDPTVRGLDGGRLPDNSPRAGLVDGVMGLAEFWLDS